MHSRSHEVLSILCGTAQWTSWFDFNIAFCLNCLSVKHTERLIEAMKAVFHFGNINNTKFNLPSLCRRATEGTCSMNYHSSGKINKYGFLPLQLFGIRSYQKEMDSNRHCILVHSPGEGGWYTAQEISEDI